MLSDTSPSRDGALDEEMAARHVTKTAPSQVKQVEILCAWSVQLHSPETTPLSSNPSSFGARRPPGLRTYGHC